LRPLCAWGTQHMTDVEKLMSRRTASDMKEVG
jgi:hypothetical protein